MVAFKNNRGNSIFGAIWEFIDFTMSEKESETANLEEQIISSEVIHIETDESQKNQDDVKHMQEINVDVITGTDTLLQEESIADSTPKDRRHQDDINQQGSENSMIISSSDVGNSTATGETLETISIGI